MRVFLTLLMLFVLCIGKSQIVDLSFLDFKAKNKLSSVYINTIAQDSLGFIWIGAVNGLQRFNGNDFEYFLTNEDNSFGIEESFVRDLFVDVRGDLWISLNSKLCRFSYLTDSISIVADAENSNGMRSAFVGDILQTEDSVLYVDELDAIYAFDYDEQVFEQVFNTDGDVISSMCIDGLGDIWASSAKGNKLYVFNPSSGEFNVVEIPDRILNGKKVTDIKYLKQKIWIATNGAGVICYNLETSNFKSYDFDNIYAYNVRGLYVDRDSSLWMVDFSGLKLYVEDQDYFHAYYHDDNYEYSIAPNVVGIFQDRGKNYWTYHYPGGVEYSTLPRGFVRFDSHSNGSFKLTENDVTAITEDRYGNLYMGNSTNGIDVFMWREGRTKTYKNDPDDSQSLGKGGVSGLFTDSKGRIWVGTYWGGLQQLDYENDKFINYSFNVGDSLLFDNEDVRAVDEDYSGSLWICLHGRGVVCFNPDSGEYKHYNTSNSWLSNDYTFDIVCASDSSVWVATSWGLSVLRKGTDEFENYHYVAGDVSSISANSIVTVFEDPKSRLWIGTANGLDLYKPETNNFKRTTDGWFSNVKVSSIISDGEGNNLWLGTDNGLQYYNLQSGQVVSFSKEDGLTSDDFIPRSVFYNDQHTLFFGTLQGITYFNYNDIDLDIEEPEVFITDVKIFNKKQKPYNSNVIDKSVEIDSVIHFNYDDYVVSLDFCVLNYKNLNSSNFAYYLDGIEEDWNYVGSQRTATYTNLKPGEYVFRVKASNNNGLWGSKGCSVKIIVGKPWWQQWWFILISAFVLLTLIIMIVKLRERKFTHRNLLLEQKVQERTQLIQEKKEMLENQKDELEEANKMKLRFFKIIAHDLRSPLSSMIQLVSLMKESIGEFDPNIQKLVDVIDGIANNMYNMLEEMMVWGNSQSGSFNFVHENVDLQSIVSYSFDLLKDVSDVKQIKLKHNVPDDFYLFTDPNALKILLRNIISNAIKFSYPQSEIIVSATKKDDGVIIRIIDQGVGMTESKANQIFDKYINKSEKGTKGEHGTGLGLLIVKEIIDKLQGEIWVESELGQGSTFFIKLSK